MRPLFILILLIICVQSCTVKKEFDYLISDCTIIDVKDGVLLPHQYIGITGDKIVQISEEPILVGEKTKVIDAKGKYLLPGLWDMHTHFYWNYKTSTPLLLANGVIGVREMFGDMKVIKALRDSSDRGLLLLPEIVSSGAIIDGVPPYWSMSDTISNPKRAGELVNKQINEGVDFLKVYNLLSRDCYFAIAKEAKQRKIPFAGHVPFSVSIWEAIEQGQYSIEHLDGLMAACNKDPEKLSAFTIKQREDTTYLNLLIHSFDSTKFDSLCFTLQKNNTWMCPTLTVLNSMCHLNDPVFTKDKRTAYLPAYMTEFWKTYNDRTDEYYALSQELFTLQLSLIGKMQKAGVKIIAGTDFPNPYCYPGYSLHDELALMVKGGVRPLDALQTATINPAIFLQKQDKYGTIEEGKIASIVILNTNPLENINNTRDVSSVFLKGKRFDKNELDKLVFKKQK